MSAERTPEAEAELDALLRVVLPEPGRAQADTPPAEVARRAAEIDMADSASILRFGAQTQAQVQAISQQMLADVRNKELGPAGDGLRAMVAAIRGFGGAELDLSRKRSLLDRLTGRAAPAARFAARYETVQGQIDRITGELESHELRLMKDIKALDLLYERTLAFYDELGVVIAAGEARLAQVDAVDLPAAQAAERAGGMPEAQALRDLNARRGELERRVHDLKLTRQVTMQALPSIRLVQENDKALIAKIHSTLVNTVPLWESQLAQAVTIARGAEAAVAVRQASDLTNDLLRQNAATLRQANAAIRTEAERGVFDLDAVREANAALIATIEDGLRIADEGLARRQTAEVELTRLEGDLRGALAAASARS